LPLTEADDFSPFVTVNVLRLSGAFVNVNSVLTARNYVDLRLPQYLGAETAGKDKKSAFLFEEIHGVAR